MGKIREALVTLADYSAPYITRADLVEGEMITHSPYNPSSITEAAVQIFREDGVNRTQEALIRDISAFVLWAVNHGEQQQPELQDLAVILGLIDRGDG